MLKNKILWLIILIIAVLLAVKFIFLPDKNKPQAGGPGKGAPVKGIQVDGVVVAESNLEENIFSIGTIIANEEAELRPEIQGKVTAISFKEGSVVNQGALLIKLNDSDFRAQLSKLESSLKLYKESADRKKRLFEMNGISRQEYDESLNQVAATEADLAYNRAQVEKTEIRAPFQGVVGLRNVSMGGIVSPNDVIATIQQLNPLKLDFSVPEKYASLVNTNDEVSYTIDGNDEIHTAKIYAIEPKIDPTTRTVKIRALASNDKNKIYPGSFARVEFSISNSNNAILIPTQSVIPILKGKKVMVVRNGKAVSQIIQTGVRKHKEIEVTSGLLLGDTVVTSGIMQLRDSMAVEVKVFK